MDTQSNVTIVVVLSAILISLILYCCATMKKDSSVENYRDPLWMNKKKMYNDFYPRVSGSIYGNFYQPWNMFSGYPVFPRAY